MDKLEYIPGDLVMTNGVPLGTAKKCRLPSNIITSIKDFGIGRWNGSERCCPLREHRRCGIRR